MGWNSVGNVLSSGLSVHVFCMMLAEIILISKLKVAENKMFCVSSQLDLQKKRSTLIYFTSVFVSGIVVWNNDISPCQCLVLMNAPWLFINNLFLKSRGKILTLFHLSEILNGWGWHSVTRTFFVVLFKLLSAINVTEMDAMQMETGTHWCKIQLASLRLNKHISRVQYLECFRCVSALSHLPYQRLVYRGDKFE